MLDATKSYLFGHIRSERNGNLIRSVAYERLYAEPPPLLDTRESVVHGVTEKAVKRHYETFYGPENAALS